MSIRRNTIIVLRSAALGDLLMTLPALRELRQRYPGDEIILISGAPSEKKYAKSIFSYVGVSKETPFAGLFEEGLVDEFIYSRNITSIFFWMKIFFKIFLKNIKLSILMCDIGQSRKSRLKKFLLLSIVTKFSRIIGHRAQYVRPVDPKLFDCKDRDNLVHHAFGPLNFIKELGEKIPAEENLDFRLRASIFDKVSLAGELDDYCSSIAVSISAVREHKMWNVENFVKVVEYINNKFPDKKVILVGVKDDIKFVKQFSHLNVISAIGKLNIIELAYVLSKVDLVLSNDGGAAHLAAAAGARVISLVPAIEYPYSVHPLGSRELSIHGDAECAPCYSFHNCPAGHMKCMTSISIGRVNDKITQVLKGEI